MNDYSVFSSPSTASSPTESSMSFSSPSQGPPSVPTPSPPRSGFQGENSGPPSQQVKKVQKFRASCDGCHNAKVKCSKEETCRRCLTSGMVCVYSPSNRGGKRRCKKSMVRKAPEKILLDTKPLEESVMVGGFTASQRPSPTVFAHHAVVDTAFLRSNDAVLAPNDWGFRLPNILPSQAPSLWPACLQGEEESLNKPKRPLRFQSGPCAEWTGDINLSDNDFITEPPSLPFTFATISGLDKANSSILDNITTQMTMSPGLAMSLPTSATNINTRSIPIEPTTTDMSVMQMDTPMILNYENLLLTHGLQVSDAQLPLNDGSLLQGRPEVQELLVALNNENMSTPSGLDRYDPSVTTMKSQVSELDQCVYGAEHDGICFDYLSDKPPERKLTGVIPGFF